MANESPESKSFAAAAKSLMETTENLKDTTKTLKETNNTIAISQGDTASAIKDALGKPLNLIKSEITAPFENIKAAFGMVPGNKILRGLSKDIMKMGKEDRERSRGNRAEQAETDEKSGRRENNILKTQTGMLKALKVIQQSTSGLFKLAQEKSGKILGILAGLLFAPIAFLGGLVKGLANSIGRIGKLLRTVASIFTLGLSEKLINLLAKGFASLRVGLARIPNLFSSIGKFFSADGGFFKMIRGALGLGVDGKPVVTTPRWAKLAYRTWNSISAGFNSIGQTVRSITGTLSGLLKTGQTVGGTVMKFFQPLVKSFMGVVRVMGTFARGLGVFLGKIFYPITLVIETVRGVMNFIDGFQQEQDAEGGILGIFRGLIGGMREALTGLFQNLIGVPLDLLKDLVAWGLKQIGFEETAALLKEFSFTDIIGDIVRWPYNKLLEIFDAIRNFDFSSLIPDLGDNMLGRGIKKLFGSGEKTPEQLQADRQRRMRDLGMQIGYRERGLKLMSPGKEGSAEFAMYTQQQSELNRLKAELESLRTGGGTTVINQNSVDASQNNNSTSVTTPPMTDPYTAWASASP